MRKDEVDWSAAGKLAWITRVKNAISKDLYRKEYKKLTSNQKKRVDREYSKQKTDASKKSKRKTSSQTHDTQFWQKAADKAETTWLIANEVTKWQINKINSRPKWQLVSFTGKKGRESAGIVDIVAMRKNHKSIKMKRGDPFEIILVQVKGGSAQLPSKNDIKRLEIVGNMYDVKNIVLSEWRNEEHNFSKLKNYTQLTKVLRKKVWTPRDAWVKTTPTKIFG